MFRCKSCLKYLLLCIIQLTALDGTSKKSSSSVAACKLDKPTQGLMNLIFDNNMFKEQMEDFDLGELRSVCHFFFLFNTSVTV